MNNPAAVAHEPAFEIRFGQVGLAQMRIRSTDADALQAQLTARVAAAPALFERAALCLDLSSLDHEISAADLRAVLDAIRRTGAAVAAVKAAPAPAPEPVAPAPAAVPAAPVEEIVALPTLMHHRPVRSGQRIYARHRDLVVTSAVGAGAEVMADGCVHVYGTLRGRAMAGVRGEVSARVFCHDFHAELVSIAGVFRVFETIPPDLAGKPVQAWLDGDDLRFGRIGHD